MTDIAAREVGIMVQSADIGFSGTTKARSKRDTRRSMSSYVVDKPAAAYGVSMRSQQNDGKYKSTAGLCQDGQ